MLYYVLKKDGSRQLMTAKEYKLYLKGRLK